MNVNTSLTVRHWRIRGKDGYSVAERSGSPPAHRAILAGTLLTIRAITD